MENMSHSVNIFGKIVNMSLTKAAVRTLSGQDFVVLVEMELYFSCLIRKRVKFSEVKIGSAGERVTDNLYLQFRPVMTQHCSVDYSDDEPPLVDFPIENVAAFVPKWLRVDYRRGKWQGEFGY